MKTSGRMYQKIIQQIGELLAQQPVVILAISGHGGAGKSTLADKIAADFAVRQEQIVRIDNLHAKRYMQAKDIFEHHDWSEIMKLLKNVRTSDRMRYLVRDDKERESQVDVLRPRVIILEGIRLLRPEILPHVDLSIWVDCPLEVATERAKQRNRAQGDSEEDLALWDSKWVPESRLYCERVQPQHLANFIYSTG